MRVALAPGEMWLVLTTPDGVWTDSAWVTVPTFLTVIVIVPVLAILAVAGVTLNSRSSRVR